MKIHKSSELKGFGFNYDPSSQPFFKALVKENLRKLYTLPTGKLILKAIKSAKPAHTSYFPKGVNVVFQPPLTRDWHTPGYSPKANKITDQGRFDAFQKARSGDDLTAQEMIQLEGKGKLIPGINAKTQVQEESKKFASDGTGSVSVLFYSNTEILSDTGTWFIPHITMGHELIHCLHALLGETDPDNRKEEYKTVGMKGYAGTYTENVLRQEAGFPQRMKYFADD